MLRIYSRSLLGAAALLLAGNSALASDVLFDPALGTLPSEQGLFFCSSGAPFPCVGTDGTQSIAPAEGVVLDSTASGNSGQVGFTNALYPVTLDRAAGFTLNFNLRVDSEEHESDDRAGFSVIVLSSDLLGIELGFWTDEVWAQNWVMDVDEFTHGEFAAFDTTASLATYSLGILDNNYTLSVAGSPLLNGVLRDYSAEGIPYNVPNFLFFGDDTTRASAVVTLGKIAFVPLPASLVLFLPALGGLLARRRRTGPAAQAAIT